MFQGLTKINMSDDSSCFSVTIKDTRAAMPAQFEYDHLLHPTTLDACFQATFAPKLGSNESRVPTSCDYMYISADVPKGPGSELRGYSKISRAGFSNFVADMTVSDASLSHTVLAVRGFNCTTLGAINREAAIAREDWEIKKVCTELVWKEDLGLVRQREADQIFIPKTIVSPADMSACREASMIYMIRLLETQKGREDAVKDPDVLQYWDWILRLKSANDAKPPADNSLTGQPDEGELLAQLSGSSVDGKIVCDLGQSLLEFPGIVTKTVETQNLIDNYYATAPSIMACNQMIAKWVELSAHKRPYQRILEVGAKNGSLTLQALRATGGENHTTPQFSQYVVSDKNDNHLPAAKELLKDWEEHLQYKLLDIEKDPIDQGFEADSFDLILVGHVSLNTKTPKLLLRTNSIQLGIPLSHGCWSCLEALLSTAQTFWQARDKRIHQSHMPHAIYPWCAV